MTDLQERILKLLSEIDNICRENDIEFYLAAGTALGAVRHKGFLPWDDDADIYMTRDNWNKFYALKDQLPEGRTLVTVEENYDSGYTINRYVDLTSTRLFRYLCASPQPAGMIVDIIILDPVPNDQEAIKNHIVTLTEYSNILCRATAHTHRCPYPTNYETYLERSKVEGKDVVLNELKEKLYQYEETDDCVLIQRDATVPHVWPRKVFGKPRYVPFENTEMPIPENYYLHLCGAFDEDWLNVPEGAGRVQHIKGVNLNISNNNAFSDFEKLVDMDDLYDLYTERQELDNLQGVDIQKQTWARLKVVDYATKLRYKKKGIDIELLTTKIKSGDMDFLDGYFKDYTDVQCHKTMIGNITIGGWMRSMMPFYIDLGDEFFNIFCRYLLSKGLLNKVVRILKARESYSEMTALSNEIKDLVDATKQACVAMEKKDYGKAFTLVSDLVLKYPENKYLTDIYYASRYMSGKTDPQTIKAEILANSNTDDVLMAIYADILWEEGSKDEALDVYKEVAEETNNGLILQSIKDRADEESELYNTLLIKLGEIDLDEEEDDSEYSSGESEGNVSNEDVGEESLVSEVSDSDMKDTDRDYINSEISSVSAMLLQLTKEFSKICSDNNIQFFAMGRTLYDIVKFAGFEDNIYSLVFAVKAQEAKRLFDALNNSMPENRYVESIINNPDFPHFAINYGAKNSIDLNTLNWGNFIYNGIKIRIEILRSPERLNAVKKYNKLLESAWTMRGVPKTKKKHVRDMYIRYDNKYNVDREKSGIMLFDKLAKAGSKNRDQLYLKNHTKPGRKHYEAEWFRDTIMMRFEDIYLPIPVDYESVLEKRFGRNWDSLNPLNDINPAIRIVGLDITYDELLQYVEDNSIDIDELWEIRRSFIMERRKFSYVNDRIHKLWNALFFAGERINLWEYYNDKKEEVRKSLESGDIETFNELMEPYVSAALYYNKRGYGMYFDDEMLEFLKISLDSEEYDEELYDRIVQKIPEELNVPIKIFTYDGKEII